MRLPSLPRRHFLRQMQKISCTIADSTWCEQVHFSLSALLAHMPDSPRDPPPLCRQVLDLDETLVYSKRLEPGAAPLGTQIFVRGQPFDMILRPGLHHFLEMAASKYIIFLYTMGDADYSQAVLRIIDPECKYFRGVWMRS